MRLVDKPDNYQYTTPRFDYVNRRFESGQWLKKKEEGSALFFFFLCHLSLGRAYLLPHKRSLQALRDIDHIVAHMLELVDDIDVINARLIILIVLL